MYKAGLINLISRELFLCCHAGGQCRCASSLKLHCAPCNLLAARRKGKCDITDGPKMRPAAKRRNRRPGERAWPAQPYFGFPAPSSRHIGPMPVVMAMHGQCRQSPEQGSPGIDVAMTLQRILLPVAPRRAPPRSPELGSWAGAPGAPTEMFRSRKVQANSGGTQ